MQIINFHDYLEQQQEEEKRQSDPKDLGSNFLRSKTPPLRSPYPR
jgi:hypothetical protein